jgi:hypothetical protein
MGRTSNHTPGTRLRPKNLVTSEGDRSWQAWHDTELDMDCSFIQAADGTPRCFPPAELANSGSMFRDANCTEEVVSVNIGACDPIVHVRKTEGTSSCEFGTSHVYAVGTSETLAMVYTGAPGACSPTPIDPPGTFYSLGAEVDPAPLAAGTEGPLPGTSRIRSRGITGNDGTLHVRGWTDTEFDVKCSFGTLDSGGEYCLPYWSFVTQYREPDCMTGLLFKFSCPENVGTPTYAVLESTSACSGDRLVLRGEPYTGEVVDSSCNPQSMFPSGYSMGGEAPPSLAPEVTRTVVEGDPGRLKPVYLTSDDGGCWFDGWYDTELGVDCAFEPFTDGVERCTPLVLTGPQLTYSDANCTVEAPVTNLGTCPAVTPPKYAVGREGASSCRIVTSVRPTVDLVPAASLPPLWAKSGTSCVVWTPVAESSYMTLGAELEFEALMAGELRVE